MVRPGRGEVGPGSLARRAGLLALRASPAKEPRRPGAQTPSCADLALELGRYYDAQQRLLSLLAKVPADSQGQPAAAELEELLGRCSQGLAQYEEAERWFLRALEHDPHRVSGYDRLARLRRADLWRTEAGDGTIRDMVEANPEAGRAYLYRWRYAREFGPSRLIRQDLAVALRLAPG